MSVLQLVLASVYWLPVGDSPKADVDLTFEKDVLPIFRANCLKCHSGKAAKARLNLETLDGLFKGGRSGAALRLGSAESSLIWEKIASGKMPPAGGTLTSADKGKIRSWINDGAKGMSRARNSPGREPVIAPQDRDFWSFRPPVRPAIPKPSQTERIRNPIDSFVVAKLEKRGLRLSPEASKPKLLRRVFYDLIGLPPSPATFEKFVGVGDQLSYERLVDQLLASPHYGERWGRHWLDAAGYADSAGILAEDRPLPLAYRYRDYVIKSFNSDKPYRRFLIEQIAGDEVTGYWDAFESNARLPEEVVEGLVATGYLRTAADSSRPDFSTIKNAAGLYFYPTIDDTLRIVASSVLGLTVHCAKCHNHKFDPIPQRDYYRLQSILMSAYRPSDWVPQMNRRLPEATRSQQDHANRHNQRIDKEVKQLQKKIERLRERFTQRLFDERLAEISEAIRADVRVAISTDPANRSEVQKYLAAKFQTRLRPEPKLLAELLSKTYPQYEQQLQETNRHIAAQQRQRIHFDEIRALYDLPGEVPTPLLVRGDPLTPGPSVSPGVLSALGARPFQWKKPAVGARTSGRRLAFARWLAQTGHPLTARVLVNRIWMHHFGEGIVATADDFGRAGARPSHPELLDWLATELERADWSIKHIQRLILTSSAYRQASQVDSVRNTAAGQVDPENRLLWRQRMRRLEAEPIRDSLLFVAGSLKRQLFGRAIPLARHLNGEVTVVSGGDPSRRSIYLQILRLNPLTLLQVFDQPVMETNCIRRRHSTVSLQALTSLNSGVVSALARSFAQRVLKECPEQPWQLAIMLAFSRTTGDQEAGMFARFVQRQTGRYQNAAEGTQLDEGEARLRAVTDMCQMILSVNEFVYVD